MPVLVVLGGLAVVAAGVLVLGGAAWLAGSAEAAPTAPSGPTNATPAPRDPNVSGQSIPAAGSAGGRGGDLQLGRWFRLSEFTRTGTKLPNDPPAAAVQALQALVTTVLDPLRDGVGKAVNVTSGYRSAEVNAAVGGADSSQHSKGEAADVRVDGYTPDQLANTIDRLGLPYDQLIVYGWSGHVHVSHKLNGAQRRERLFQAVKGGPYVRTSS